MKTEQTRDHKNIQGETQRKLPNCEGHPFSDTLDVVDALNRKRGGGYISTERHGTVKGDRPIIHYSCFRLPLDLTKGYFVLAN